MVKGEGRLRCTEASGSLFRLSLATRCMGVTTMEREPVLVPLNNDMRNLTGNKFFAPSSFTLCSIGCVALGELNKEPVSDRNLKPGTEPKQKKDKITK